MHYLLTHFLSFFQLMVVSGILAILIPAISYLLLDKRECWLKNVPLVVYVIGILILTVFSKVSHSERLINLIPFWSYTEFDIPDMRYQVYMNIFLFIPLGFLIPFTNKKTFLQTLILGCCLSIVIEALQYIFALGLCETDDVIHNTLGCIIGYWYWIALNKLGKKNELTI